MKLQFPFNYNRESDDSSAVENMAADCYSNNEGFAGGFYPVGENNFWHNGIHLQARKGANDEELPVKPLADGHLIACRVTEDYILAPVPKVITEARFYKHKTELEKYYRKAGKKYALKAEYKDKVLDDELKDELKELLELRYSNNFALLKHSYKTPKNQPIDFFSLYMHLCPKSYYPENKRPYFEKWSYTVDVEEDGSGVIFYDEEEKKEIGVVPFNSIIEILPGDHAPDRWYNEAGNYGYHLVQAHALDMQVGVMKIRKDWKTVNATRKAYGRYDFTETTLIYDFNEDNKMYPVARTKESEEGFSTSVYDYSMSSNHWFFEAKQDIEGLSCLWIKTQDLDVLSGLVELNRKIKKCTDGSYEVLSEIELFEDEPLYSKSKPEKVVITKLVKGQRLKVLITSDSLPPWLESRYIWVELIIDKNNWIIDKDTKKKTHLKSIIDISKAKRIRLPKYLVHDSKDKLFAGDYKENKKGLALYQEEKIFSDTYNVVSRLLEKDEEVVFQDDQAFLDKQYGKHKLSKELYSGSYLDLGEKENAEGKLKITKELVEGVEMDSVNTFKEPEKVDINRVLGYTGKYLEQGKIVHIETFTGDNSFIDNPKQDGLEKSYYLVKAGTTGFKQASSNIEKDDRLTIYPKTWVIPHTDGKLLGKAPYEKSIEVEVDSICVWIKLSDIAWNNDDGIYKVSNDVEYGYVEFPDNIESASKIKLDIKKGDKALPYWTFGDSPATKWKKTDKNKVSWRYVYIKVNSDPYKHRGWLKTDEVKLSKLSGTARTDKSQYLFIHGDITNKYEIKEKVEWLYKGNPELLIFKNELKKNIGEELKVKQKQLIEKVDKDGVIWLGFPLGGKDDKGNEIVGFIKKDELEKHEGVELVNPFDWTTEFDELVEPEGMVNGKCDLMELISPQEEKVTDDTVKKETRAANVDSSTKKEGETFKAIKYTPNLKERLHMTYGCRPTEWSNATDVEINKFGVLGEAPKGKTQSEIDWLLENRIKPLQWWDDVKGGDLPEEFKLPDDPKALCFFHPISFIKHMHNIVELDVVSLINSAEPKDGWRQLEFKGKTVKISMGESGYRAIKDALSRKTEKRDPNYGKNRPATDKSFSENMKHTLKCFFNFLSDPEITKCEDIKVIKITSTFRENDKHKDANHMDALALDFGGDHFHFWSNDKPTRDKLKFDREVALLIARKFIEHGAPQIMMNCPYVKANIAPFNKDTVNTAIGSHHHHLHVGYLHKYSDNGTKQWHCFGVHNAIEYECVNYKNCTGFEGKK